jgi:hypothetical protein
MTPPIFPIESPRRLAHLLGFSTISELEALAARASSLYEPMRLLVPGKEARPIKIPRGELREVQRRILRRVFSDFTPHRCSFGGIKGRSARNNAEMHLKGAFILEIDVRKFYPNVHHRWVQHFFECRLHCSPPVARILRRLLTLDAGLPQGTCTSPALADQLMKPIDRIFASVFNQAGAIYTRFVDDITISAAFRLRAYLPFIARVLKRFGLRLHPEEEFFPGDEAVVTGFSCRKTLGLPSAYVSQIASELEQALVYAKGEAGAPPPYCPETYWGIIEYVRRVDASAGRALRRIFSNIRWTVFSSLDLPCKKGILVKDGVIA